MDPYAGTDFSVVDTWVDEHREELGRFRGRGLLVPALENFGDLVPGGLAGEALARMLATFARRGALTREDAVVVMHAWCHSQYPHRVLSEDEWRGLFRAAGYVRGYEASVRPSEPMMLYRGATEESRLGWSWTPSLAKATEYASGMYQRTPGSIWVAAVQPERLLGYFFERGEDEYVIDTAGMPVVRHSTPTPAAG